MKRFLILSLLTLSFFQSFGQYTKTEKTTKTIVQQRSIYLNGGLRASTGGKSRVVIPFDLPKNTVEWYYSFSTSAGTSGTKNLNLAIQLSSLLIDQTGSTATMLEQVKVPSGSSSIDVYLLDSQNQRAFEEKWDNNGGTFYHIIEGTAKNTKQAVIRIDDVTTGRVFLGLKNPSTLDGVNIFIEVTAIVRTQVYVDEWTTESKNNFKSQCLTEFLTDDSRKNEVCDCQVDKITSNNLPSQWNNQSVKNQKSIASSELDMCFTETNNLDLKNAEEAYKKQLQLEREELERNIIEVQELTKESEASASLGSYKDAREKRLSAINLVENNDKLKNTFNSKWLANSYNTAVWYSLLLNELDIAGEHLKSGLSYDTQNMYMRGNLGLFHLLKGNYPEAEKAFLYYKRKQRLPNGSKWVDVIAKDLDLFEQKGMSNSGFKKIRTVLKIK